MILSHSVITENWFWIDWCNVRIGDHYNDTVPTRLHTGTVPTTQQHCTARLFDLDRFCVVERSSCNVTASRDRNENWNENSTSHLLPSFTFSHRYRRPKRQFFQRHGFSKTRKPSCRWQTRATLEIRVRGHSRSSKVTPFDFLSPSYSNFMSKMPPQSHKSPSLGVTPCEFSEESYLARKWNHGAIRWCNFTILLSLW